MSATLDADLLVQYMVWTTSTSSPTGIGNAVERVPTERCTVLTSAGRTFPVEIKYSSEPTYNDKRPVWDQAAEAFSYYVNSGGDGDVLVFMPGGFEISQTIEAIRRTNESRGFILLPLHGELSPKDQDAAVAR